MDIYRYAHKVNQNHKHKQAMSITLESGEIRKYTYDDLFTKANVYAERFHKAGVSRGDRVVLVGENSPEWQMAFLAIMQLRATVALIDPNASISVIKAAIQKADARCIVTTPKVKERLGSASYYRVPVLNLTKEVQAFADSYNVESPFISATVDPMPEMAMIFFEGKQESELKGILYTHQAMIENVLSAANQNDLSKSERILSVIPNCKIEGMIGCVLAALLTGATVHYVESLDEESLKKAFKWFKPTIWPAPNGLLVTYKEQLLKQIEGQHFDKGYLERCKNMRQTLGMKLGNMVFKPLIREFGGKLELIWCQGPIDEETILFYYALGIDLLVHYGNVETNTPVLGNRVDEMVLGTCGRPYPNIEVELRNPNEEGLGEIYVKSPYCMAGYFREEQKPTEWLVTGDLGKLEEGAYVKVFYHKEQDGKEKTFEIQKNEGLTNKSSGAYYWFMAWKKTAQYFYKFNVKHEAYLPSDRGCILYTPLETKRGFLGMTLGYSKEQFYKFGYLTKGAESEGNKLEEEAYGVIRYENELLDPKTKELCVMQLKKGWHLIVKGPRDVRNAKFTEQIIELAKLAHVPIIPAYLEGEKEVFHEQESIPKLFDLKNQKQFKLELRYGKPISIQKLENAIKKDLEEQLVTLINNQQTEEEPVDDLTKWVQKIMHTGEEPLPIIKEDQKMETKENRMKEDSFALEELEDITERLDLSALLSEIEDPKDTK